MPKPIVKKKSGRKLEFVSTLGTHFDNNCIELTINDEPYRLDVEELLPLLKRCTFETEEKRVHIYLSNPKLRR